LSTVYFRIAARGPPVRHRAPALERLLARADAVTSATPWRAEAFRVIAAGPAAAPAVATAALRASHVSAAGAWVLIATPVHFIAGMSGVGMPADGILDLGAPEADALAADFNQRFCDGGARLIRGEGGLLLCALQSRLDVATTVPEQIPEADIWDALPSGPDAGRVRRLMSEIEMWLFEHPVNEDRRARGLRPISGLWLWGGGEADAPLPDVQGWTAGEDPLFAAFARRVRYPDHPGAGVVVIAHWPGTSEWREVETQWLSPAFADLKSGGLRRIELSVAERRFSWRARSLRRFWRSIRPWWEDLDVGETVK